MTPEAIILMVVAIVLVWGGLVASIVALVVLPQRDVEVDEHGNVIPDMTQGTPYLL